MSRTPSSVASRKHRTVQHTPTPAFSPPPPDFPRVRFASSDAEAHLPVFDDAVREESGVESAHSRQSAAEQAFGADPEGWNGQCVQVILAINGSRSTVGSCAYDGISGKLLFLEDQQDSATAQGGWEVARLVIEQVRPDLVLTSASADATFLTVVETALAALPLVSTTSISALSSDDTSTQLEYRPAREFFAGQGRHALTQLHVADGGNGIKDTAYRDEDEVLYGLEDRSTAPGSNPSSSQRNAYDFGRRKKKRTFETAMMGDRTRRNAEMRLECFLGALSASPLALGSAGALLAHLTRTEATSGDEESDDIPLSVSSIGLLRLEKAMFINKDALVSLQIFDDEVHASTHSSDTKEGLSLFGVINLTCTPTGRLLLRQWTLRPSLELEVIEARHSAIECFLRSENQHITDAIRLNFRGVKNAPKRIRNLATGKGTLADWQTIWQESAHFLYSVLLIRDACLTLMHRRGARVIETFLSSLNAEKFKELGAMINDVIDWDESRLNKGHVAVKSGVDSDLDELRRRYHGLSSLLTRAAEEVCRQVPPGFAESVSLVYFPQLGYLINVPFSDDTLIEGRCEEVGWDFQFHTESYAYFKSDKCRDLDYHLGDIHSFIGDKELDILQTLLGHVLDQEQEILAASDNLAELDCLLALTEAARLNKWNKPVMTDQPICKIQQGRHPLVELTCDSFVPNDTYLLGGQGVEVNEEPEDEETAQREFLAQNQSMLLITGANFSGKSVLLKQIAIIVFMAHIGSFVPAERAFIGLTDRILTRVSTKESISRGASAFTIDLQQIAFMLRNATRHSLCIVDEFGKGTESDDGAGLFTATLENLIRRGVDTPRVLVATHFHSIFATGLLSPSLPIGMAHMEILVHDSRNDKCSIKSSSSTADTSPDANLTYLYRLKPGLSLQSHALSCAALFGIPSHVLERANQVSNALARCDLAEIVAAPLTAIERKDLQQVELVGRKFLEWDLEAIQEWTRHGSDRVHDEVDREAVLSRLGQILGRVDDRLAEQEDDDVVQA